MNKQILSILTTPICRNYLVTFYNEKGVLEEKLFFSNEELCDFLTNYFYIPEWSGERG